MPCVPVRHPLGECLSLADELLGNIITPMVKKNFEDDPGLEAIWQRENMLGRLSQPYEYRGAALFLLSDASSFMTGSQVRLPSEARLQLLRETVDH